MSEACVVAVYRALESAQRAVHILDRAQFPRVQISMVTATSVVSPELNHDLEIGDDSLRDAALGAGLGAAAGLLAGLSFVATTTLGVFLLGPLAATGAIAGAFLGGLAGWGVQQRHLRYYERAVRTGKVLVVANGSPVELVDAERVLAETDAVELHVHARSDEESPVVQARHT